jgi:hypothetical protein
LLTDKEDFHPSELTKLVKVEKSITTILTSITR